MTDKQEKICCIQDYIKGLKACLDRLPLEEVVGVIELLEQAYQEGRQVFIIGNGGSAATASHMACDLSKNIHNWRNSRRFRVLALTENISWVTALANDLGYEHVFAEQLKNLAEPGDLVVAITGSGNSKNIIEAIRTAKHIGAKVVGILGFDGGKVRELADACVVVNSGNYGHIEDVHLALEHLITTYFSKPSVLEIVSSQIDQSA